MAQTRGVARATRRRFGSIRKLPSGKFQARYTGADDKLHSAPYTFQTKGDADRWLVDQEVKLRSGEWEPPKLAEERRVEKVALTFGEYADRVLARRKLGAKTAQEYRRMLDRLLRPKFGSMTLAAVTPAEVSDWYGSLKSTPTQQANAYALLKSILKEAVDDELLTRNPCKVRGGSFKSRAREPETLTLAELSAYVAAVPEDYRVPVQLMFWCGLRSGEVRALRRRDLDLKAGTLTVAQAVTRVVGEHIIKTPKTVAGARQLLLPPHLIPLLREWLKTQPVKGASALLFTARDSRSPLSSQTLSNAHIKARNAIGRPGLTPHGLRHSAATLAAQQGAATSELMARFGWDTPAMAAKYSHAAQERDRALANKLSEAWAATQAE